MSSSLITVERSRPLVVARLFDYCELIKPRIAVLVVVATGVAAFLAQAVSSTAAPMNWWVFVSTLLGTALVGGSASAFNQWIERHTDALMERTAGRPLPAGRLTAAEVFVFAAALAAAGLCLLAWGAGPATTALGFATWLLYVCVYTPLKQITSWNTAIGAVAGAMPVLMGWSAVGSLADWRAWALFGVLFLWQFPHFMAIAWIYRRQYGAAGLKMTPVVEPSGRWAGWQAIAAAAAMIPLSMACVAGSGWYFGAVGLLGVGQLLCAVAFAAALQDRAARRLLFASLVYLPAVLILLTLSPLNF